MDPKKLLLKLHQVNQMMKVVSLEWCVVGGDAVAVPPACLSCVVASGLGLPRCGFALVCAEELFAFHRDHRAGLTGAAVADCGISVVAEGGRFDAPYNAAVQARTVGCLSEMALFRAASPLAKGSVNGLHEKLLAEEFVDISVTEDGHIILGSGEPRERHWKARLSRKLVLKPPKESSHEMTVYHAGDNKVLLDLECRSGPLVTTQSFLLIDY